MNVAIVRKNTKLTLLLSAAMLLTAIGSSFEVSAGQEKLAEKIAEASKEVTRTRDQLQATMTALTAMVRQKEGDLKPAYATYTSEVAKTQTAGEWTRQCAVNMKQQSAKYFGEWQEELKGLNNDKLRKQAEKRLAKVQKSYDKAAQALETAGTKFRPFLSDLADIEKVLAKDITAGGMKSLRSTVSSAEFNLGPIRRSIDTAIAELEKVSAGLQPEARK